MQKKYLILGGTSGIGLELVNLLVEKGHIVHACSRKAPPKKFPKKAIHHLMDVMDKSPAFPDLENSLDGLAYMPGSINLKPFGSLKTRDFRNDFDINVAGAVKTLQYYQNSLEATEDSSVVLFSTVAAGTGLKFHTSVAASKAAVEGLTRALAAEWAPGIRVNCVAPSLTDTPLAKRLLRSDRQREDNANRHPLKRIGTPEDLAKAAAYLLSPESSWITGQTLHADGGISTLQV